jgi:hypothetical protein
MQWTGLDADTQRTRRLYIERFQEKHGEKRIAPLTGPHIEAMIAAVPNIYARRHWLRWPYDRCCNRRCR